MRIERVERGARLIVEGRVRHRGRERDVERTAQDQPLHAALDAEGVELHADVDAIAEPVARGDLELRRARARTGVVAERADAARERGEAQLTLGHRARYLECAEGRAAAAREGNSEYGEQSFPRDGVGGPHGRRS